MRNTDIKIIATIAKAVNNLDALAKERVLGFVQALDVLSSEQNKSEDSKQLRYQSKPN